MMGAYLLSGRSQTPFSIGPEILSAGSLTRRWVDCRSGFKAPQPAGNSQGSCQDLIKASDDEDERKIIHHLQTEMVKSQVGFYDRSYKSEASK